MAAYWKALSEMTKLKGEARIYSTSTGQFVLYEEEELAQEWERLSRLAPEALPNEIPPDPA